MALLLAAIVAACVPATGTAGQRVTVEAVSPRSTAAVVRLWRRDGRCWRQTAGPWRAYVGRNGLAASRREGDGTTPIGTFPLGRTVYGVAADPGVRLRYHRLECGDWWDADPSSPTYNTFRHVRCGEQPAFGGGSEALWLQTRAYRHFAVIEYNVRPVVAGRGSAMFIHADLGHPTNGCVSLPLRQLVVLLRWLRPAEDPIVSISAG
jgi:L,D-peptidoglycan transpeptidase YkuD (ErfK/YbiS/YcfS/YnhG family)